MSKYFDIKKAKKLAKEKIAIVTTLRGSRRQPHKLEAAYINYIDELKQQLEDKDKEIEELKYKIDLLQFLLDIIELDKLNPLSPYKWDKLSKEDKNND